MLFFTALVHEYQYDLNGNRISDANKKISNVTYNKFNLPSIVTIEDKGYIEYIYDAAGIKLQKRVFKNGVENKNASQTYIGSYI